MAVLVEGISVIVRRDSINRSYQGGWDGFVARVPNSTLCSDAQLARIGFLDPASVKTFIGQVESCGLVFMAEGKCVDITVVDQQRGPTMPCDWLEFTRLPMDGGHVGACWLFEGPRSAAGVHLPGRQLQLATPVGWTFKGSLSEQFRFVPTQDSDRQRTPH